MHSDMLVASGCAILPVVQFIIPKLLYSTASPSTDITKIPERGVVTSSNQFKFWVSQSYL